MQTRKKSYFKNQEPKEKRQIPKLRISLYKLNIFSILELPSLTFGATSWFLEFNFFKSISPKLKSRMFDIGRFDEEMHQVRNVNGKSIGNLS